MERALLTHLKSWLIAKNRKPLVIRGARQVGKTWLVRSLAETSKKQLIEFNFEKQPSHANLFNSNDTQQILLNISAKLNQKIDPKNCLLFLDEIQAAPQLFSKLRWFAEELPQLPVIATGSLLEFLLADHSFSMPVGRINYFYLEPLSFEEFLLAKNKKILYEHITTYNLSSEISPAIHEQLIALFKEYILIGGLPEAVASWTTEQSLNSISQIQHDLLATYRGDFAKYKGRFAIERLDEIVAAVPKMLGEKFIFSNVNASVQASSIKQALNLLEKARVCHHVQSCSANGAPLAAEIREKFFKEIFLDVGLCSAALGFNFNQINNTNEIAMINSGGIAEQVAGQILRTIFPPYVEPALYYWHREEVGSNAEIDYVIQHGNKIIPIEVKAGTTGKLKSLHLFMELKKLPIAVRINSNLPSKIKKDYTLISIPFYLAGQIHRLLDLA